MNSLGTEDDVVGTQSNRPKENILLITNKILGSEDHIRIW